MRPSEAVQKGHPVILEVIKQHGLSNVRLFGSALYNQDTESSDLDLLVDPNPDTSLLDLIKAQNEIAAALGVTVELLTPGDLPEKFRFKVLKEAKPL